MLYSLNLKLQRLLFSFNVSFGSHEIEKRPLALALANYFAFAYYRRVPVLLSKLFLFTGFEIMT